MHFSEMLLQLYNNHLLTFTFLGEAEAQCAQLCKEGLVYGIATEDMDGLTFGAPKLIRNLSTGSADNVKEFDLQKTLAGLGLDHGQFIDLCILMGCDYCGSIRGVGPKTGLELIRKYGSIEEILTQKYKITEFAEAEVDYMEKKLPENDAEVAKEEEDKNGVKEEIKSDDEAEKDEEIKSLDEDEKENSRDGYPDTKSQAVVQSDSGDDGEVSKKKTAKGKKVKKDEKLSVPENWLFKGARYLFVEPNVHKNHYTEADLKQKDVDEEGLIKFMCEENGFSEERIKSGIKRIKDARGKSSQSRIDSFFKVLPGTTSTAKPNDKSKQNGAKRKTEKSGGSGAKRGRKPK